MLLVPGKQKADQASTPHDGGVPRARTERKRQEGMSAIASRFYSFTDDGVSFSPPQPLTSFSIQINRTARAGCGGVVFSGDVNGLSLSKWLCPPRAVARGYCKNFLKH